MDDNRQLQDWQASSDAAFANRSIEELAVSQGVEPVLDPYTLAGGLPDDEDVDDVLDWIYRRRR